MSSLPFPVIARNIQQLKVQIQQLKLQCEELAKGIVIHEALPREIFVMILRNLSYKSINVARGTCTHWRNVIDSFNVVEKIWGKHGKFRIHHIVSNSYIFNFSECICNNSIKYK